MRHPSHETIGRHRHQHAFVAIVLKGGYTEIGDTGRHRLAPGDAVLHKEWEAHSNHSHDSGAEVLILPASRSLPSVRATVADPDALAVAAERDPVQLQVELEQCWSPVGKEPADWTDSLAQCLIDDPSLNLARWADQYGLHPGSLSRSFRKCFGLSPAQFRQIQRGRKAIDLLLHSFSPLAVIAAEADFSDQSHMTRVLRGMTNRTPGQLVNRKRSDSGPRCTISDR